jgi:DNA polymerase I-like protein with 3'-5' exonuclease and polymerase domains
MYEADTGRINCSGSNMQNVPKRGGLGGLHNCVVAAPSNRLV